MKLLEGKVAIITGAGGGIGRCHAIAFAKEGAKIVVNDLGGTRDGAGTGNAMADKVVVELKELGAEAVANYDSVSTTEGAENIIKTAVDAFGRVDILVNNAGILRDKTLLKMTDEEFDLVIAVHLRGTWACSRAAATVMKDQDTGGHIINTSSIAGLQGNFGQSNYGAAKAGIYALTRIAALELTKHNIAVNAIAPVAKTRMTEDIESVEEDMLPEDISPMVTFLAADSSKEITGNIYGIHGKQIFEYKMNMTDGIKKDTPWTPIEIAERFTQIGAEAVAEAPAEADTGSDNPVGILFHALPTGFVAEKAGDWKATIHFEITGAGDWGVAVESGECKVTDGKPGAPSSTITIDKDTMLGMASGKVDGQTAFMKGKIKASRLDELAKFGKVFDFKKMKAAAPKKKAAAGGASAGVPGLFKLLPTGFVAEKAGDWKTNMHFEITGAGDWSVAVDGGKCSITEGKPDAPTSTVTIDKDTMLGMASGKIDGQTAFMKGKIKASRLDELAKFGKVFDFKKMKAAATSADDSGAEEETSDVSAEKVLASIAHRFIPEKATGFNGAIQFKVDGQMGSVVIEDGTCRMREGKHPSPTCTIEVDAGTLWGILTGAVDAQKAHSDGKVKLNHPPSWIKFRQCFRFEEDKGLNRGLIGRKYSGPAVMINPEWMQEYDEVVGDKGSLIFPVALVKELFAGFMEDPDFSANVGRMVHGEQLMRFHAPLAPWDLVAPRAEILAIEDKASGQILNVGQKIMREGQVVVELESRLFFRGEDDAPKKGEKKAPKPEVDRGAPSSSSSTTIADDLPMRYSGPSGDDNPIHTDLDFAKSVGFKNVILQGLCTMAVSAGNLPKDLKEISVRFTKPVLPGDTLTTSIWENGNSMAFEVKNQDGDKVISNGTATLQG